MKNQRYEVKLNGFVLYEYHSIRKTVQAEYFTNFKELKRQHRNAIDDKWDWENRNGIHWFYLNMKTMVYYSLPKWLNDYIPELKYEQCKKTIMSEITTEKEY